MQVLNVTNLPIYLPNDKAPLPFGDPLPAAFTNSGDTIVVTGYDAPANGDLVAFSNINTPNGLTAGLAYFVVGASGATFQVSLTKGGSAVAITADSTGTAHLLSNQVDGVTIPFKPGYTVVVLNLTGGGLVLQGAADSGTGFGNPAGPGSWNTIASVGAGAAALAQLSYDWIRVSTSATLVLLQN